MQKYRLECSLAVAVVAALICLLISPAGVTAWWTVAFEPLCDAALCVGTPGEEIVMRSLFWEWITGLGS